MATFDYPFSYAGVCATLSVEIETYQEKKYSCLRSFAASIDLQLQGKSRQSLGWIYAYTLDKRILGADGQLVWLSELLQFSKRQKAPHREHASDHAVIDETQRMFQLLFNQQGAVRDDFKAYEHCLTGERLHYISHFVLEDNFIGQGLGPSAMQAYLQAIQSLSGGDDVHGTVFLSPGAIVENYEEQRKSKALAGSTHYSYQQVQDILIRGYEKSGYELWFKAGDTKEGGDIAIMGLVLPSLQASRSAEEDMDMDDVFNETSTVKETIDPFLATLEAMMDVEDDPVSVLSVELQKPAALASDVEMTDNSTSEPNDAQSSKPLRLSSPASPKLDRTALERAIRADETYVWSGSRFLVDYDIELNWLLRAKQSNRKLIQALFPDYELPPPVSRRSSVALVPFDPEQKYLVRRILAEEGERYLIQWEDDPDTGRTFRPTWEPKDHANALAVAEWQQRKTRASAPRKL